MQSFLATARERWPLIAAAACLLAALPLVWPFVSAQTAPAVNSDTAALTDEPGAFTDNLAHSEAAAPEASPQTEPTAPAAFAIVYISGAVAHPDVYQVPINARVKDVVMAAGGLTEQAAAQRINLAEHIADAQHIHIPSHDEAKQQQAPSGEAAGTTEQDDLININTASVADLDSLPGIGQSIAERIVEYRTANGPFQSAEDLRKVKGIGPALFSKIAALVTT